MTTIHVISSPFTSYTYHLFTEFVGEFSSRQITNSLGLQHVQAGHAVTIASGLMLNRYRVQASDALAVPLVVQQLVTRLKDKAPVAADKLSCTLSQQHLQLVHAKMDAHFAARLKMKAALVSLAVVSLYRRKRGMIRYLILEYYIYIYVV